MRLSLLYTNGTKTEWFTFNTATHDFQAAIDAGMAEGFRLVRVYRYS